MTTFTRWIKFNLVGVIGMAVQLAALALFNHLFPGHYLIATAAAIELALLHNFLWHTRYTWRDCNSYTARPRQLLQFHLSNGLVSMLGNLMLMRFFIHTAHLPLLLSNTIAVAVCSFANFLLANSWTFAARRKTAASLPRRPANHVGVASSSLIAAVCFSLAAGTTHAQQAPQSNTRTVPTDYGTDCAYENIFVGPAATVAGPAVQPSFTAGVTVGQYFARPLGKGFDPSPQFELGIVGPLPGGHAIDGLASVDMMLANKVPHRELYPFFNLGYTRMFVTGNAVNFGFGIDLGREKDDRLIRIELRDYYLFTGPQQHIVGLRIGFGKLIAD